MFLSTLFSPPPLFSLLPFLTLPLYLLSTPSSPAPPLSSPTSFLFSPLSLSSPTLPLPPNSPFVLLSLAEVLTRAQVGTIPVCVIANYIHLFLDKVNLSELLGQSNKKELICNTP